ncbi:MAG: replication initiation factor domain-containing protein [Nevskia sp.]|nr:replication initiation factor domain-containing protein [Nevskia sp.]
MDWLAFTVTPPPTKDVQWVAQALVTVFKVSPQPWKSHGRGWNGYSCRVDLNGAGLLAHGGDYQRGTVHVELNASGCAQIADWNAVRLWGETYGVRITRIDLAHDDFDGKTVNIDLAKAWYKAGGFNSSGRPPRAQLIDDFDSGEGKTLYIGRRENGKLLRIYEKGRQLGDVLSLWVRIEVELHNQNRVIPWDAVTRPGHYLAGAYPALAFLNAEQERLRTTQRTAEITYDRMVEHLRMVGGKAINAMCQVHGEDKAAVVDQLRRDELPERLKDLPLSIGELLGGWIP